MSSDKRRLYRLAEPVGGISPVKAALVQGQPVASQRTLVSSVPVTADSGSMSLRHAVDRRTSPKLCPSSPPSDNLALADETVSPRKHAPRQYLTPTRHSHSPAKRPTADLTPSDEDSLPQLPASRQDDREIISRPADCTDVSSPHHILFQETLDSGLGSGEVPLSTNAVLSPARILRHDRDTSLSGHGLAKISSAPSSVRATKVKTDGEVSEGSSPSLESNVTRDQLAGADIGALPDAHAEQEQSVMLSDPSSSFACEENSGLEVSNKTQKKQKPKGRYVASRYMQAKPPTQSVAPANRPRQVTASRPPSSIITRGAVKGVLSRQKAPAMLSYRTPHALPADQLLLRARQATADSLFTPSLQVPGASSQVVTPASHTGSSSAVKSAVRTATKTHTVKKPLSNASHSASSVSRVTRTPAGQAMVPSPATTLSGKHDMSDMPTGVSLSAIPAGSLQRQLNCLYARALQWAFLESRAKHAFHVQEKEAERWLYAMWQEVESLKRQEARYREQIASMEHASLIDLLLHSQLPSLQQIARLLPELSDTHKVLAQALNSVHHQLPVRGFRLPRNLDLLVDAVDESEHLFQQLVLAASPSQEQLQQLAQLLTSLEEIVSAEMDEVRACAQLVQQAARVQTALTSLRLHLLQLEQQPSMHSR